MADWSTRYLAALDVRDGRESTHKAYIDACTQQHPRLYFYGYSLTPPQDTRLADRKTIATTTHTTTVSNADPLNPQSHDEISRLRQDLSTTQAARSALASQLQTHQTTNTALTTSNKTLTAQLTSVHRQLASVERKLKDRDEELRAKKKLVEQVQDEIVALTVELNAVVREKEKLKAENGELVRRWMERMTTEVDRANREGGWE
ncbi:hypothetical protein E4T49_06573 [Aureobasidium sp. EXF-10728]|nr:hypothetical protein E4T49_06573 [Aureobasidium sp. EXF-10728]